MDPLSCNGVSSRSRLPRSRGDGPPVGLDAFAPVLAPPLARGWTHGSSLTRPIQSGSPARAGMDLNQNRGRDEPDRLPRSRGDGPEPKPVAAPAVEAPPLARGWTPSTSSACRSKHGSPARAGMDPCRPGLQRRALWLPRSRGDGPDCDAQVLSAGVAPPLARGWTPNLIPPPQSPQGSPARAGMDPGIERFQSTLHGLPRSRGDGPESGEAESSKYVAPPLARGWTF